MIQDLLWRCPLCATNDALRHKTHWPFPDTVDCTACGARWHIRRAAGDNYYLKIHRPGANDIAYPAGFELSVTSWFDVMKTGLHLESLPGQASFLENHESLYLDSGPVALWTEGEVGPTSQAGSADRYVGQGRLFLTDRRIFWLRTAASSQMESDCLSWPLHRVDSVDTILNLGLFLAVSGQLYVLRFDHESPLKWVTYVALLAPGVQAESGHRIRTSHH